MPLEDLGLIGNCQCSALVDRHGTVVWGCLPRFDSPPLFAALLDEAHGGRFTVGSADGEPGTQRYVENTTILETTFVSAGGTFRVVDFMPRFIQYNRAFRPAQLFRILEPVSGTPLVRVRCDPRLGWSGAAPERLQGSNHIRFEGYESQVRLTTDIPLAYLGGQPFALTERRHLALTWGAPIEEPLPPIADRFLLETTRHWRQWVKHCNIPPHFQAEVIRSALTLKLHCYEDTGAIVAAMTTSIPESPGSGRTWDYRYCWLRDAFYALGAFRLLGHFEEREQFTGYLFNLAARSSELDLRPLYRIDGTGDVEESILEGWPGFGGSGPVRVGNAAARHTQNDIYGEMVLALAPVFLDDRFSAERTPATLELLERLAIRAIALAGTPDASIWEFRTEWKPQTFSSLMSWAAADRMAVVAQRLGRPGAAGYAASAATIREAILASAWNEERGSFTGSYGGRDLDASLLQMATLRFLPMDDVRLYRTIEAIRQGLALGDWLYRYRIDDGFGTPKVAFILCTFWLVEALVATGRQGEAREVFARATRALSPLGLLSEDYDPGSRQLWGNFPQAYSHIGLIHAAFAASPRWGEVT